jgi:hypothetical protein
VANVSSRSERSEKRRDLRSGISENVKERRAIKSHQASSLAKEAFEFGAPLLLTSIQADYIAQVTEPTGLRAPVNQFGHGREFVDASDRTVLGFNVDNLYSFAVVDASDEPMVLPAGCWDLREAGSDHSRRCRSDRHAGRSIPADWRRGLSGHARPVDPPSDWRPLHGRPCDRVSQAAIRRFGRYTSAGSDSEITAGRRTSKIVRSLARRYSIVPPNDSA